MGRMVTHGDLQNRFNLLAIKINSLLAKEPPVEDVDPGDVTQIVIGGGMKRYFCARAREQLAPLKMHMEVEKGVGTLRLFFSQTVQRPGPESNDKAVSLMGRDMFANYSGSRENEKPVFDNDIFFTIESEHDIALSVQCVFGKSTSLPTAAGRYIQEEATNWQRGTAATAGPGAA